MPAQVYQLRIALDGLEPEIKRRLWVPTTLMLARLDRVIQVAMGWANSHITPGFP